MGYYNSWQCLSIIPAGTEAGKEPYFFKICFLGIFQRQWESLVLEQTPGLTIMSVLRDRMIYVWQEDRQACTVGGVPGSGSGGLRSLSSAADHVQASGCISFQWSLWFPGFCASEQQSSCRGVCRLVARSDRKARAWAHTPSQDGCSALLQGQSIPLDWAPVTLAL